MGLVGAMAYLPGMPPALHDSLKRSLELPLTWISLRQSRTNSSVDLKGLGHCLEQSHDRQHTLPVQPHLKLDLYLRCQLWKQDLDLQSAVPV